MVDSLVEITRGRSSCLPVFNLSAEVFSVRRGKALLMSWRGKALVLSFVFVLLFSAVSANASTAEQKLFETKCQASDNVNTVEAPNGVTLNGEEVDEINCSNFEAYEFPPAEEVPSIDNGNSPQQFFTSVLLPSFLMFAVGGIVSWKAKLGWKRPLLFLLGAVTSFIGESTMLWLVGVLNLDFGVLSFAVPLLIGLFALPSYLLYSGGLKSRGAQSEAAVGFLFIGAINWLVVALIFFVQSSLSAYVG